MMSRRISTFFLNRNLRPRRLEQFYSGVQSTVEPSGEAVDTPIHQPIRVDLKDNESILNFVNKKKNVDNSMRCFQVIKLSKLNTEQNQVGNQSVSVLTKSLF